MDFVCEKPCIFGILLRNNKGGIIPQADPTIGKAIQRHKDEILAIWKKRVVSEIEEAKGLPHPIIIDTVPTILDKLSDKLLAENATTISEGTLAEEHGGERARLTDFNLTALIKELCIFRDVIFHILIKNGHRPDEETHIIIYQFIDRLIQDSATSFSLIQADLRENVIATLTHDMRSPLTAATLAADMILRKAEDSSLQTYAKRIKVNHQRIDGMIQDLLNTTLLRSGGRLNLKLETFDIKSIVDEISEGLSANVKDRLVSNPLSITGTWDRGLLKRAIENLLSNAFKYGKKDTKVTLEIENQNKRMVISVHNEGPVIPKDEQEAIFQIFRRAEAAKQGNRQGWGLGLPLVRAVAESHGGSIGVDSIEGKGTKFGIDIPIDARPYQDSPQSE